MAVGRGLSREEYVRVKEILGRVPSYTELLITAALWSERCSYKSSKVHLRELPSEGEHVLQGPGENAGVVDLGNDWVAVFKMESRTASSAGDPEQVAAAGVGGVARDVFAMGARPIACLDSLRFGELAAPGMRQLIDGVVRGIGGYGNCAGFPTVGGETGFHPGYDDNVLVNLFALGLARRDRIVLSGASGKGNRVFTCGRRTGRAPGRGPIEARKRARRKEPEPPAQSADPFAEKILLEACLEVVRTGAVAAIQDLGSAGLCGGGRSKWRVAARPACASISTAYQ